MAYKVMNKTMVRVDGQITSTVIDIRQEEPYTIISREIGGDHTNTTDNKAIELVLEVMNNETTKPGSLKKEMKLIENAVSEANEVIEEESDKASVTSDALEELLVLIYEVIIPRLPDEEVQEESDEPVEEETTETDEEVVE